MLIRDYVEYLRKLDTDRLFGDGLSVRIDKISDAYGDTESDMVILETRIDVPQKNCDYSIRLEANDEDLKEHIKEYWHELDYDAVSESGIVPCMYMDASYLKPGMDMSDANAFIDGPLSRFAGEDRIKKLKSQFLKVLNSLDGKCSSLYQLGIMISRQEDSSMRVFLEDINSENVIKLLEELEWDGDRKEIKRFIDDIMIYSRSDKFKFDFDIYENHISSKVGINFDPMTYDKDKIGNWLKHLTERGLCLGEKSEAILDWMYTPPQYKPFVINDLSHFKFIYDHGIKSSKVYLRQCDKAYRTYNTYFRPIIMNLELTDRCPLHCRQCYCDLNHGKDMSVETARYWIKEAGKEKVDVVNLSGGESILYEGLTDLIRECRKYDMKPNAAFSGWGLSEEKIRELIDAGIEGIFISLNGSTEEINSQTRDGYQYAIDALKTLQKIGFERTCVNWVMHRSNADDFENVIALCENYDVAEIAVMVFKPDAAHELPDEPTAEQMKKVAGVIKGYKGKIKIEAETCFSQMRTLIGQKFFTNLNRGVGRGCGAGRDGFSVSADGKLSPCRHIELYEEYDTIKEYWENSGVLKELRTMEDRIDGNCSGCRYKKFCLPCAAVNLKMHGYIAMGHESCRLNEE